MVRGAGQTHEKYQGFRLESWILLGLQPESGQERRGRTTKGNRWIYAWRCCMRGLGGPSPLFQPEPKGPAADR